MSENGLLDLVIECRYESDLDRQIELLEEINQYLPELSQLKIPSLITNDYVIRALDIIEDKIRYNEGGQFLLLSDPGYA